MSKAEKKNIQSKEQERLERRYSELLGPDGDLFALDGKLSGLSNDPDVNVLRGAFCNELLYTLCAGYAKYPEKDTDEAARAKRVFLRNVALLPNSAENAFFFSVACFYKHDHSGCIRFIREFLEYNRSYCESTPLDEATWADFLLDTFKNGFHGFWPQIADLLKDYPCNGDVVELCRLVDAYYRCRTDDEMIDLLLPFAGEHPTLSLPKELLGFSYLGKRMWNNALACFEQVEGKTVLFYESDIDFQIAWCHGKLKNIKAEEEYYRKCLDQDDHYPNALNNLGYCLYKRKKHTEAITVFEQCLVEKRDLPFAANNYVRALLATGQYKTAHDFISKKNKVSSDLVKRVQLHSPVNETVSTTQVEIPDDETDTEEQPPDFGIKRHQFSSEKVLEDELSSRIEAGHEVFGQKLKIYKRTGDFYGRQYPIANGKWRLDLLCEDHNGDMVVIELKKDSGYDDPYEQITNYMKWLKEHKCRKGQKVYGIICLNAPPKTLIDRVRKDALVSLFEYQISYREIR